MPLIDKPLPELETYLGRNPRPADFDDYWQKALAELNQVKPEYTLTPSSKIVASYAECFDLVFKGVGGADIYAQYLRPKGAENAPILLQFHGYSANAGDWYEKLGYVAEGFCVASMDCRGQGGLSTDPGGVSGTTLNGHIVRGLEDPDPKKLLFRSIFLDTVQLARTIISFEETDENRLAVTGGSQGGALTLACAALEPRVKYAAAMFPFLCDYQRVWEMDLAKKAYEELSYYLRRRDPQHENVQAMFEKLGYIDIQHLAPRIQATTLFGTGLMDDVCPPSTQFAAYNRISAPKSMEIFPDFGHEALPGFQDKVFNFLMQVR
ncbi:acetylxylan esterase [Pelagicoccus albus]|uniref:Acetylxylan esterase n=1 Tax=Pelagicoccus albus TaxID=415222 RepID=A0A7X1B5N5_9BACT|nr:acetylxylan esterase [Pelagicoccus albus]MBC2605008.1 acetylxylan esterase [Pelagicoccus albus]